jgi:hypothetical protein
VLKVYAQEVFISGRGRGGNKKQANYGGNIGNNGEDHTNEDILRSGKRTHSPFTYVPGHKNVYLIVRQVWSVLSLYFTKDVR